MKNRFSKSGILCIAMIAVLSGCQKEELRQNCETEQDGAAVEITEGRLVSCSLKSVEQADAAFENALNEVKSQLGTSFEDYTLNGVQALFNGKITGMNWQLETYRIHYRTVDINGEEIILAGDVAFVNESTGFIKRKLNSVSLVHAYFQTEITATAILGQVLAPFRTLLFNSLVVSPFYQGIEIDEGLHTITVSEPLLKARQAIDCELAALEFIEGMDNVEMKEDYCTYNMGASNGGSATLATQYLLENDPELKQVNQESIHLKSTYGAEGCYAYSELISLLADNDDETSSMSNFKVPATVAVIVGTYDTWKAEKTKHIMDSIDSVDQFFSDEFNAIRVIPDSTTMEEMSAVDYFRTGTSNYFSPGMPISEVLNPEMFNADSTLNEEHPYIKALQAAFAENDVILRGWNPASQLCLSHSAYDDFVPYEQPKAICNDLSNNGWNRNVMLKTADNEEVDHFTGTLLFCLDMAFSENPCDGIICRK